MKYLLTIAASTLVTLVVGGQASAQYPPRDPYQEHYGRHQQGDSWAFQVADSWYRHYLGRPLDRDGINYWVPTLQQNAPEWALAHMLGSDEYIRRNGGTMEGLVAGLFRDMLGQRPRPEEVRHWVNRVYHLNENRQEMIEEFIQHYNVDVVRGPVGRPAYDYRYNQPTYSEPPYRPQGYPPRRSLGLRSGRPDFAY
jgi:hypothetical protein